MYPSPVAERSSLWIGSNIVIPCTLVGGSYIGTLLVIPFPARIATDGLDSVVNDPQLYKRQKIVNRNASARFRTLPVCILLYMIQMSSAQ